MKYSTSILALFASVAGMPVSAQDIVGDGEFIGVVTIGDSRRGVQTDTATSQTVIDQAEIEARQASSTAELLSSVPNVALTNAGLPQGSSVSIRGLGAQSGVYSTDGKVAIVVNGVASTAEEIYRNGAALALEPDLFRELTVTRGPAESFKYSSGAMGGTIEAETKSARDFLDDGDTFSVRQKLAYESNGDGVLSTTILSFAPDDKLDVIAFLGGRVAGNRADGSGDVLDETAFGQASALLEATYQLNASSALKFHISRNEVPEEDVLYSAFSPGFSNVFVDRDTKDTTAFFEYSFDPIDNDLINLDVRLTLKKEEMRITSDDTSSDIYNTDHNNTRTALSFNNEAVFDLGATRHLLNVGAEYSWRERRSEELAGTYAGYNARSAPGGKDEAFAVYVSDEISAGAWTLTPQLRYEHQTLTSEGNDFSYFSRGVAVAAIADGEEYTSKAWTGALSAKYDLTQAISVFGTVAYNENLPILDDLRNATYREQPEKGRTLELGASFDGFDAFAAGDALKARITAFDTAIWDGTTYSGIDQVDLYGAEVEVSYAHPKFYVDFNAAFTRGTINGTSSYFKYAPADQAQLTLGKRFFDDQLDLAAEIVHAWANNRTTDTDPDSTPGTVPSDAYTVANLTAVYKPKDARFGGAEFYFGIDNVFDKAYQPYLSTRAATGRNFKVTVVKTF